VVAAICDGDKFHRALGGGGGGGTGTAGITRRVAVGGR